MNDKQPYGSNWYNVASFRVRFLQNKLAKVDKMIDELYEDELAAKESEGFPEVTAALRKFRLSSSKK